MSSRQLGILGLFFSVSFSLWTWGTYYTDSSYHVNEMFGVGATFYGGCMIAICAYLINMYRRTERETDPDILDDL